MGRRVRIEYRESEIVLEIYCECKNEREQIRKTREKKVKKKSTTIHLGPLPLHDGVK